MVPAGATLFRNPGGTAPGLALADPRLGTTVLLPGVPAEMRALLDGQVVPYLARVLGPTLPILSRTLRTTGIAESVLAERVAGLIDDIPGVRLAFLPTGLGIDLRITSWGELEETAARRALAEAADRLRRACRVFVYGTEREDIAEVVGTRLRRAGLRLAVAESCTGGLLAGRITAVPGSSDYFLGGVIAYANSVKQSLLGVLDECIREYGAVSEAVALELARGAVRATGADCAVAITGVAGPGGGTPEKPVGTVWIAVQIRSHGEAALHRFTGAREEIRARAAQAALALLLRQLDSVG